MISRQMLGGLVLAGGQARRMQAPGTIMVDKGLMQLDGLPLVARACGFLAPQVDQLFISANQHHDAYREYGCVVTDSPRFGISAGPLAGVASALGQSALPWLLVVPVDVPVLPSDLLPRLSGALESSGALVAYAATAERAHPLCMLLHRDELDSLQRYLLQGGRKVGTWQSQAKAKRVEFEGGDDLFFNINTPADLVRAQAILRLA